MYYLKNKYFTRWARKQGITDKILWEAINEFKNGLFEADLGNHLFKKRIALAGRGKSSGTRTILFYQKDRKLIFCFGFEKSQQDNLSRYEFNFLNELSDNYQILPEEEVIKMIKNNRFFEISRMER
jgi:hypothetical protein